MVVEQRPKYGVGEACGGNRAEWIDSSRCDEVFRAEKVDDA